MLANITQIHARLPVRATGMSRLEKIVPEAP
jgi:hypothetical protein